MSVTTVLRRWDDRMVGRAGSASPGWALVLWALLCGLLVTGSAAGYVLVQGGPQPVALSLLLLTALPVGVAALARRRG